MLTALTLKGMATGVAVAALAGCAGVNGTRPQDMTVPQHEEAARAELRRSRDREAAEEILRKAMALADAR